jgi:putative mRNA 3-end processing factor
LVYSEINNWWLDNQANNRASVMQAYSLGKAQRILYHLDRTIGRVFVHPTIKKMNEAYREAGADPGSCYDLDRMKPDDRTKAIFVVPSINPTNEWVGELERPSFASASGWFGIRNAGRRRNLDKSFVLSDHADWKGLNWAIEATGADNVYVTHGYVAEMMRWLNENGKNAQIVNAHE